LKRYGKINIIKNAERQIIKYKGVRIMELTRIEIFKAMNSKDVQNVKELEGMVISPVAFHTHSYEDQEGKEHAVLVIKDGKTGNLCKTEVQAFIKKFLAYDEAFGSLPDAEKPEIVITMNTSKKGNKYVNFDIAG